MLNESVINRLRLATGSILFAYVLCHLLNHGLGVISVAAMQAGLHYMIVSWGSVPGEALIFTALVIHILLALRALWRRRSLRMPALEAWQLVLGFLIPLFLAQHIAGTTLALRLYDGSVDYNAELLRLYVLTPINGLEQVVLLVVAWSHGCIGLNYTLKLKSWYPRAKALLFAGALLVPALALIGFLEGGREVAALAQDPVWIGKVAVPRPLPPGGAYHLKVLAALMRGSVLGLLVAVLVGRVLRRQLQLRRGAVVLTYPKGRRLRVAPGTSVLEASRAAGIPHAAICGGRGRCSTCRIRVLGELSALPEPGEAELRVLHAIGAPASVRLACQLRPTGDVEVMPLLPADASAREGFNRVMDMQGMELEIAVLFCDIRSFTKLAEHMLPYDVVFLLNRYFAEMGRAVEEAGGKVDKFLGDGVMALFGVERGPVDGCRAALAAVRSMAERLDRLNAALEGDLKEPIRIGIGLHAGRTIVGEMGYGKTVTVTAIGDAVNTASRLEAETKPHGVQLVVSDIVARHAGLDLGAFPLREIEIRGRDEKLAVRMVASAKDLPASVEVVDIGGATGLTAQPA